MDQIVAALVPLANSKVAAAVAPAIISSIFGAVAALVVFWFKSREPLDGAVVWRYQNYPNGELIEEPFVAVQNRSAAPAFIKRARLLKGNFIKREASRSVFSFFEMTDGAFPLEIAAQSVSTFPLLQASADKVLEQAYWFNKVIGYLLKRPFLWVELKTISGRRIVIPANDAADYVDRPLWIELRWFPPPKSLWASTMNLSGLATKKK